MAKTYFKQWNDVNHGYSWVSAVEEKSKNHITPEMIRERERNFLFNDALNTFYLRLYGVRHIVKDHSDRKETRCCYIGYSYRLTARVLLYAPSHRQDNTYHSLCYTSRGALAGTKNSSIGPPHEGSIRRPITPWANALPLRYFLLPEMIKTNNLVLTTPWTLSCVEMRFVIVDMVYIITTDKYIITHSKSVWHYFTFLPNYVAVIMEMYSKVENK